MSWQEYVGRHMAGRKQVAIAHLVEVDPGTVSRWRRGLQGVDAAAAIRFARAVGDEPLTALIEAGYLTPAEAKAAPAERPDFSQLTNDELLELVRGRMREEGEGSGDTTPNTPARGSRAEGGRSGSVASSRSARRQRSRQATGRPIPDPED